MVVGFVVVGFVVVGFVVVAGRRCKGTLEPVFSDAAMLRENGSAGVLVLGRRSAAIARVTVNRTTHNTTAARNSKTRTD